MKLYLSSYGLGNHPEHLQQLVGDNKRAAVIVNAQDDKDATKRQDRLKQEITALQALGFQPEELDLRQYFGKTDQLSQDLEQFGLLWIRGGNVFVLQRAMRQSGFDQVIRPLVESEQLVYAGFSAGACAATPHLRGIELVDDKDSVPEGYNPEIVWEGLGFVPYSIAPHYKSDHPESLDVDRVVDYMDKQHMPYQTLQDGQVIIVDGGEQVLLQ